MSTDKSLEICYDLVGTDDRFKIIDNSVKKCSLENIYNAVHDHTHAEDIVVILDGDDFLANADSLQHLDSIYNLKDCWVTYGSYMNLSNKMRGKFSKQIPEEVIRTNSFRDYEWCTSHLRSFKSFLFKKIDKANLQDESGEFFDFAGDLAIMFPLLELAGHRSTYIDKILYIWNDLNELNEHKRDNSRQLFVESVIRRKEKYDKYGG
jgi:hypothetical protein